MERELVGEYFKGPCFHSHDQFKATWNESAQNILGKAQSPLTGVGRYHSSMYKWGLAPSPNCECGATEQTADHVYLHVSYIMYQEEHEVCKFWMIQLDVGLTPPLPASNLGSASAWDGKRIDPRPDLDLRWPGLSLGA